MSIKKQLSDKLSDSFDKSKMSVLGNIASSSGQQIILERTNDGKFLDGDLKDAPYSSSPIPIYYLGKVAFLDNEEIAIKPKLSAPVNYKQDEILWTKQGAFAKGGYKRFRQKSGRRTSKVILQYTGRMLSSFKGRVKILGRKVQVIFGVSPDQSDKAYYTNLRRKWMDLTENEVDTISKRVTDKLDEFLNK